jgi:hypothetical protein
MHGDLEMGIEFLVFGVEIAGLRFDGHTRIPLFSAS